MAVAPPEHQAGDAVAARGAQRQRDGVPAGEALGALPGIIEKLPFKVQFPVEVRFTGPDDIWLSHGYGRDVRLN